MAATTNPSTAAYLDRTFKGHTNSVRSVCVTVDGKHLITGSEDKTARVWSLEDGALIRIFTGHTNNVTSVCVTPDGNHLITGSLDKTARLWSLADGTIGP